MNQKIILYIAQSLDGFIAREDGSLDWLTQYDSKDQDYGYNDFLKGIGVVVMGNNTYRQVLTFGDFPYKNKACFVFSNDISKTNENDVTFVNGDVAKIIEEIKKNHKGDIWLVGGAMLIDEFLKHEMVDEFIVTTIPVIIGRGIPLFSKDNSENKLQLVEIKSYKNGLLQAHYKKI